MKRVLIVYTVSALHMKYLKVLCNRFPDWEYRFIYESQTGWIQPEDNGSENFKYYSIGDECIPNEIWEGHVDGIIFSTLQQRFFPLLLLMEAKKRKIPIVAYEESNQLALNQGRVNNYVLPVDDLFLASEEEERWFRQMGFDRPRISVTGWPFYDGKPEGPVTTEERVSARKALGLPQEETLVLLTLTRYKFVGESRSVRSTLMKVAHSALPEGARLVIKAHPIEPLEMLQDCVNMWAPGAIVLEGKLPIEQVLEACDVLLNRGDSQVCFQALYRKIPILVIRTELSSLFDEYLPSAIVETANELSSKLEQDFENLYQSGGYESVLRLHMPYKSKESFDLFCNRLEQVLSEGYSAFTDDYFSVVASVIMFWLKHPEKAISALDIADFSKSLHVKISLKRILENSGNWQDFMEVDSFLNNPFYSHFLKALWIRFASRKRNSINRENWKWLEDFPTFIEPTWFEDDIRLFLDYLGKRRYEQWFEKYSQNLIQKYRHLQSIESLEECCSRIEGYIKNKGIIRRLAEYL